MGQIETMKDQFEVMEVPRTWTSPELFRSQPGLVGVRDIVQYYYPENTGIPQSQAAEAITLVNQLLIPSESKFYIDQESILPVLNRNISIASSSGRNTPLDNIPHCFKLFVQFNPQPHPNNESEYGHVVNTINTMIDQAVSGNTTLMWLNHPVDLETVDPVEFGFAGSGTRICRIQQANNSLGYLILEEKVNYLGTYYYSISYAVDDLIDKVADSPNKLKTVFTFEVSDYYDHHNQRHQMTNWDKRGQGEWLFNYYDEPFAHYYDAPLSILAQPLKIHSWDFDKLYYACARGYQDGDNEVTGGKEEYARSRFFLEMANVAATLLHQAVFNEVNVPVKTFNQTEYININDAIADESKEIIKNYLHRLGCSVRDEGKSPINPAIDNYSFGEHLLYDLLGQGRNIWKDLGEFSGLLIRAYQQNPERFWYYFSELGLHNILPYFRNIPSDKIGQALVYSPGMFDLVPRLSKYHDPDPRKEFEQSDEYFMELALAKAAHNYEIGEMPIAACLVNKGKAISTLGNKGKKPEGHAEARVMNQAEDLLSPEELIGSKLYTTLGPCGGCINRIREGAKWITEVFYGLSTSMMDFKAMRFPHDSIHGEKPYYQTYKRGSGFSQRLLSFYRSLDKLNGFHDLIPFKWYEEYLEKRPYRYSLSA